jgi:hypothetical protein
MKFQRQYPPGRLTPLNHADYSNHPGLRVTRHTVTPPLFVVLDTEETTADYAYAVADTRLHATRPLQYLTHHRLAHRPLGIPRSP